MKVQALSVRPGNVIEHEDKLWNVLKIDILQPGKGGAFVQVEMRDVKSGNKTNVRFRTQETVEKLMIERAMSQCEGNVTRAAKLLGLSRAALYRRFDKHGLETQ